MERKRFAVTGMSCSGCEQTVENAIRTVEGVRRPAADHESDSVEFVVEDGVADEDIEAAIADAGYDVPA